MKRQKRTLQIIARGYDIDPDIALVALWDHYQGKRFNYLKNDTTPIKIKDISLIKRILRYQFYNNTNNKTFSHTIPRKDKKYYCKNYDFENIGKRFDNIVYLSKDEVLSIHDELASDFSLSADPINPVGLKHESLLESALFHPQTSYDNCIKYPTLESSAAALMYALSNNHPFHNGNKRTAIVSLLVFLDRHNFSLTCDEDELFLISIKLADHKLLDPMYYCEDDAEIYILAKWIHNWGKSMKQGERLITLMKLKRRLNHFDCVILENGKIERTIKKKGLFSRSEVLISKKSINKSITDSSEVDRSLIKSIRDDLRLNPEHGIDSEVFYEGTEYTTSDFIIKYKNLLKRLAKI